MLENEKIKKFSIVQKSFKTYIFKVIKIIAFSNIVMSRNVKIFQFIILVNFNFLGKLRSSLQNVNFEPTLWIRRFNYLLIWNLWNKKKLLLRDEHHLWIERFLKPHISPGWSVKREPGGLISGVILREKAQGTRFFRGRGGLINGVKLKSVSRQAT